LHKQRSKKLKISYFSFYAPNNAILAVTGNITFEKAVRLAEKWLALFPKRAEKAQPPAEPQQDRRRRLTVERKVPIESLYMAFRMCDRMHPDYYALRYLSDILSNGRSSRLIQHLVHDRQIFSSIDATSPVVLTPVCFISPASRQWS
jgi:predicted Zn-dependent peptidase